MAIQRPEDGAPNAETRTGAAAGQQEAPQVSQQQTQFRNQVAPTIGITEVGTLRRGVIGKQGLGESVDNYKKTFDKMLESLSSEDRKNFQIDVMNKDTSKVFMSSLIFSRTLSYQQQAYVIVYALAIEASNPLDGQRRVFQNGGVQLEISWAASDVIDPEFFNQLTKFVNEKTGGYVNIQGVDTPVKIIYAGGRVLPQELKSDDEAHLSRVLHEIDQAMLSATEQNIAGVPAAVVNVGMFLQDGTRASVSIDPTPTDRDNAVGLPVRSSLNIQLRATKNVSLAQQAQSLNQRDQDVILTRVDAFVDPTFDTTHLGRPQQNNGFGWNQQQIVTQRFIPRITITAIDSVIDLLTPETTLLGLASVGILSNNPGYWANSLHPRRAQSSSTDVARLSDISAIGLAAPVKENDPVTLERVNTKGSKFTDQEFERVIEAAFVPTPIYTLLVEESGERSWLNDMFQFAASGHPDANAQIIRAADNLTLGHFSQIWAQRGNGQIVHNDDNRVHMGYFVDNAGKKVDLLHVDTLAMLNLFAGADKDEQIVWDWIQTFNPSTGTLEARLALREQILRTTFNQVTIKGYARSVTFYGDFISALVTAIAQAGLHISPANTTLNDFRSKPQFGIFDPAQFGVTAAMTGGAFSYGGLNNNSNSYRGIGGMMSGNFGR